MTDFGVAIIISMKTNLVFILNTTISLLKQISLLVSTVARIYQLVGCYNDYFVVVEQSDLLIDFD